MMSAEQIDQPFGSIESAHAFMDVLAETILDAMKDLAFERQASIQAGEARRTKAIDLALFKLKLLTCHVHKSRRTLNDLRMIRRLILNERATAEQLMAVL
jgi:hypothetical protein